MIIFSQLRGSVYNEQQAAFILFRAPPSSSRALLAAAPRPVFALSYRVPFNCVKKKKTLDEKSKLL